MGIKCSSVTDFIARYQYGVISNRLKQPVTDRALISNELYELVTDRFNLCNGLYLTSVTNNSCNGRFCYQKSTLVAGHAEDNPGVSLPRLSVTGAK
jgi:hypothetical protein